MRLTKAMPGVVDVVDELTHSGDDTDTGYPVGG